MQNAKCKKSWRRGLRGVAQAFRRAVAGLKPSATFFALWAVVTLFGGCTAKEGSAPSTASSTSATARPIDRQSLKPISFPDITGATPSAQKQLRDAQASFSARLRTAGAPDLDLGKAYGEMGTLLLAAEYRQAAEPYLLNAQALDPTEIRWPYFLAHLYRLRGESANAVVWFERSLQLQPD